MGDLRSTADAVREAAVKQASQLASDVGVELNRTVEAQKQRGVEAIKGFAKVVSNAADDLEDQSPVAARSVRDVASRIEDFSDTISHRDVDDLLSAATSFARARPMLFLGGAVLAGFALARFLKTSSDRRASASDYSATRMRTSYDDNAAEI